MVPAGISSRMFFLGDNRQERQMKRQIFTLLMALVLTTGAVLMAQSNTTQPLPPDQQVDQSGQPETGTGPDVDVDVGRNAEDGLVDVDVDADADSDTAAQGNDPNPRTGTTGQTGTTGTMGTTGQTNQTGQGTTTTGVDTDMSGTNDNDTDTDNLPDTAGKMPLLALIGLLSLAGAVIIRVVR